MDLRLDNILARSQERAATRVFSIIYHLSLPSPLPPVPCAAISGVADKYSPMNILTARRETGGESGENEKEGREGLRVEREKGREPERRVIVRGEGMKFTGLHIAVVTFHPPEFILPFLVLVCVFRGLHGGRGRNRKRGEKHDR